jgi:hypothetical protein
MILSNRTSKLQPYGTCWTCTKPLMATNLYRNIIKSSASSTARLCSRQAIPLSAVYEDAAQPQPQQRSQQQQQPTPAALRRWQCASRSALLECLSSATFQQEVFEREVALLQLPRAEIATLPGYDEILREPWADHGSRGDHRPTPGQRALCFVDGSFVAAAATTAAGRTTATVDGQVVSAALSKGHTLLSHAVQLWSPATAELCLELSGSLSRTINANLYCCAAALETALAPHNDSQCVFIWQLEGSKRWQVWLREAALLPVDDRRVFGKHRDRQLDLERLGQPDLTLVLQPGDVMYLPRGALHATDTAEGAGNSCPSVHLTVGVDSLPVRDFSTGQTLPALTVAELLRTVLSGTGSGTLPPLWQEALHQLQDDVELRRSAPVGTCDEGAWAETVREGLHKLVDAVMDDGPEALRKAQAGHAARLAKWRTAMAALARDRAV